MRVSHPIAAKIIALIQQERMPVGTHLGAQKLADRLQVSRSPVNEALKLMLEGGIVTRAENRGYFLAVDLSDSALDADLMEQLSGRDVLEQVYFDIADDLLRGDLPLQCTESLLRSRYKLTGAQLQILLARIANEGWATRTPGYGWAFSSMITTPDSLLQSYRLRLALEPAALLEPGFSIGQATIDRCRAAEVHLLEGGIETDTADQLHDRGVRFHESLIEASGNPFFIETIQRVNKVRRLLSYRSMRNRARYREHCEQHLEILALLEQGENEQASNALRRHLQSTLKNLGNIRTLLSARNAQEADQA